MSTPPPASAGSGHAPADAFSRVGRLVVARPVAVLLTWGALVAVLGVLGLGLHDRLGTGGFDVPGSQSLAVQEALERDFPGQSADPTVVVVHAETATAADKPFRAVVADVAGRVERVDGVSGVTSVLSGGGPAMVSPDGRTTYLAVALTGDQNEQVLAVADVVTAAVRDVPAGFDVVVGGRTALYERVNVISKEDLEKAELLSLPVTAAVLLLAFGGAVAAGLPLLLAVAALMATLGLLFLVSFVTTLSIYVTSTASIIGIGVGIDYSLFVVTRYREELATGLGVPDAVVRAVATSGRSVAVSGLTVVVALAGMFLVDIQGFRSMAVGSMTVVVLAVVASLTLMPAVLALLGTRVNALSLHRRRRGGARRHRQGGWHRWAMRVMRRPWPYLVGAVGALALLSLPLGSIQLGQPSATTLPEGTGPRVALERLESAFGPGAIGPVEVLVDAPDGVEAPATRTRLEDLGVLLAADPGVVAVRSVVTGDGTAPDLVSRDGRRTRVVVVGRDSPQSPAGQDLVRRVRDEHVPAAGLAGRAVVGGQGAADLDLTDTIGERLPWVVGAVLGLSFLLLVVALRSLVLPLKAIAMNLLSVGAAYGSVVAVFQWGWGADLLGFAPEGFIQAFVPLFLFCVLFGLSMDYEVFLMTRIREEWERTRSNTLAVARGLERTGRTVTSAALIMVVVFAAFAGGHLLAFKAIGFGLAAAVLIDATLVRVVAVPAAMRLLGEGNWWLPRSLARVLPHLEPAADDDVRSPHPGRGPAVPRVPVYPTALGGLRQR